MLKASWKFSLGLLGLRMEYSNASGKNRCTKAQNAMPSFQLEEKLWMSTPCFVAEGSPFRRKSGKEGGIWDRARYSLTAIIHRQRKLGHIYLIWLCFGSAPIQKHLFDIFRIRSCSSGTFLGCGCSWIGLAGERKQRYMPDNLKVWLTLALTWQML